MASSFVGGEYFFLNLFSVLYQLTFYVIYWFDNFFVSQGILNKLHTSKAMKKNVS